MKGSKLLHSGGWKKLAASGVTKEDFKNKISELLNIRKNDVIDFYGMVESLGVIFMDCEEANKHVPDFSDVIIRDPVTFEECHDGTPGLIEVISAIPESYPGHAILTEDIGQIKGVDDCKCGRKGKYFVFLSRTPKSELRGCGDTFSEEI